MHPKLAAGTPRYAEARRGTPGVAGGVAGGRRGANRGPRGRLGRPGKVMSNTPALPQPPWPNIAGSSVRIEGRRLNEAVARGRVFSVDLSLSLSLHVSHPPLLPCPLQLLPNTSKHKSKNAVTHACANVHASMRAHKHRHTRATCMQACAYRHTQAHTHTRAIPCATPNITYGVLWEREGAYGGVVVLLLLLCR